MATPRNARPGMLLDPGAPINRGLVGWWPMWEGAGGKTLDISGKGNHGTLTNGPVWADGGLKFDGGNDRVLITKSHVAFPITITTSIYLTAASYYGVVFSHDSGGNDGYRLQFDLATRVLIFTLGGVAVYPSTFPAVPLNTWTTIGVSVTANGGTAVLYKDNVSSSASIGTMAGTPTGIVFADFGSFLSPQACILRNTRFWNRILSAEEFQQIHQTPNIGLWVPDTTRYYIPAAAGSTASSTGTSTVSGVGASTAASSGAASGASTATATGASTAASVASASGTSTAAATGASTAAAIGAAAGTSTVAGSGASTAEAVGTAAGTSTVSGVGTSTGGGSVASASGTGTVTGVGAATAASIASAAGVSTVSATGAAMVSGVGVSAGLSTVSGIGASTARTTAAAAGSGTAAATGASTVAAVANAAGSSTAAAISNAVAIESYVVQFRIPADARSFKILRAA